MSTNIEKGQIFTGSVKRKAKDGLIVELQPGAEAYVHVSQLTGKREQRDAALAAAKVGDVLKVQVTDVTEKDGRTRIAASQSAAEFAEREQRFQARQAARQAALGQLSQGSSVTGVIKRLESYGVLVTLAEVGDGGTIDGLLHVTEIQGDRRQRDRRLAGFKVGDKVEVEVVEKKEVEGKTRIRLSEKRASFRKAVASLKVGTRTSGAYRSNDERGLVIELNGGVEAILPHDALGTTKPESITRKPGQTVKVIVDSVDETAGVIWLTRKGL